MISADESTCSSGLLAALSLTLSGKTAIANKTNTRTHTGARVYIAAGSADFLGQSTVKTFARVNAARATLVVAAAGIYV